MPLSVHETTRATKQVIVSGRVDLSPPSKITLADVLQKAGYRTALFGKWHLGTVPECSPNAQGFDEFFGHKAGCIDNWSHFFYWNPPHFHDLHRNDKEVFENGRHFARLITREAKRFIGENRERPFFLYLPFNADFRGA
ncbi:MAG: sulfatase-like hydrolase/transferase [Planctomycetota bacterium]|nr:sulfatase-like hydrolase/transferase [Planctomycetota bacterium]